MHRALCCQRAVNTCKALMCLVHMLTTAHIPNKSRTSISNTSRVLWCGEWDICFSEWCMFHIWMQFLCLTQQLSIVNILHNMCQTHVYKLNMFSETLTATPVTVYEVSAFICTIWKFVIYWFIYNYSTLISHYITCSPIEHLLWMGTVRIKM